MKKESTNNKTRLKYLLNPFFEELDAQNVVYCVCGNYQDLPEYTSNDVDIWAENTERFEKILFEVARNNGFTLYLYNKTANGSNNFFYKIVDGNNNIEFIGIDILNECVWFPFIPIVKAERIKEERLKYKNFYVAGQVVEASMHFLFSLINHEKIKEKYKEKIYTFHENKRFYDIIAEALGRKTAGIIISKIKEKDWYAIEKHVINYKINLILRSFLHFNLKRFKYFYNFIWTNLYRLFKPSGLFIVFIGPDGAGKTTIINRLAEFFNQGFLKGKVKQFYWRPFLLPPLKKLISFYKKSVDNGNKKFGDVKVTPRNVIFSFVKFFYYFVDYVIGRVKYQREWSRGGIVCFDRYYYDNIVCPQRFEFIMPRYLMNILKCFIPKPDITFYLSSPSNVLKERKDEYPVSEIENQAKGYDDLMAVLPNAYRINTTYPIHKIENKIIRICIEYMAQRLKMITDTDRRFCGWHYFIESEKSTILADGKLKTKILSCTSVCGYFPVPVKVNKGGYFNRNSLKEIIDSVKTEMLILLISTRIPLFLLKRILDRNNVEYAFSYILLPSFNNPRLFLPSSKKIVKESGKVLRPTKFKSVIAMKLLYLFNWIGCTELLFSSRLIVTKRKGSNVKARGILQEFIADILGRDDLECILYTGAKGVFQKYTAQIMDGNGKIIAYAKIAHTKEAQERIGCEVKAINYLKDIEFSKIDIPEIISVEQLRTTSDVIMLQTPPPENYKRWNESLTDKHIDALIELFHKTRRNIKGEILLEKLQKDFSKIKAGFLVDNNNILQVLDNTLKMLRREIYGTEIPLGFSQGDFIPWNIYTGATKLFVFDWEVSQHRVPLWDLFYYILYSELFVFSTDHKKILNLLCDKNSPYCNFITQYKKSFDQSVFFNINIFLAVTLFEMIVFYIDCCNKQKESCFMGETTEKKIINTASFILKESISDK